MTTIHINAPRFGLRRAGAILLEGWAAALAAAAGWPPRLFPCGAFGEPDEEHRGRCLGW